MPVKVSETEKATYSSTCLQAGWLIFKYFKSASQIANFYFSGSVLNSGESSSFESAGLSFKRKIAARKMSSIQHLNCIETLERMSADEISGRGAIWEQLSRLLSLRTLFGLWLDIWVVLDQIPLKPLDTAKPWPASGHLMRVGLTGQDLTG